MAVPDKFRQKISNGADYNFFERKTVTWTTFGQDGGLSDVLIPIRSNNLYLSLINEGAQTISYSFDGHNKHGDLVPGTPSEGLSFEGRSAFKIWLKLESAGSADIRIEAYDKT